MPGLPRQSENSSASHLNGEVLETPLFDTPDARDQPITPRTANGLNPAHPSIDLFILDGDLESPPPSPSVNELVIGIIALKRRISTYDQTNTMAGTRANLYTVQSMIRRGGKSFTIMYFCPSEVSRSSVALISHQSICLVTPELLHLLSELLGVHSSVVAHFAILNHQRMPYLGDEHCRLRNLVHAARDISCYQFMVSVRLISSVLTERS